MDNFIWHSKASAETATWLASQLNTSLRGLVPPSGFNGTAVCWGAGPSDIFKWERRNFRSLFNDPRKVRKYTDRRTMFAKIGETGTITLGVFLLAASTGYENTCNLLNATPSAGFVACKNNGSMARLVKNQGDIQAAMADGCTLAIQRAFLSKERIRLFVVGNDVVACTRKTTPTNASFADLAAAQLFGGDEDSISEAAYRHVMQRALDEKVVAPAKSYWMPYTAFSETTRQCAVEVCKALEFDFCAVDVVITESGAPLVLNVVTTPNLREVVSIQQPIIAAIAAWVTEKAMTSRELLLSLVHDATDAETDAILVELRKMKGGLTGASTG